MVASCGVACTTSTDPIFGGSTATGAAGEFEDGAFAHADIKKSKTISQMCLFMILCGPLRISAFSALRISLPQRAQRYAEGRRETINPQPELPVVALNAFCLRVELRSELQGPPAASQTPRPGPSRLQCEGRR